MICSSGISRLKENGDDISNLCLWFQGFSRHSPSNPNEAVVLCYKQSILPHSKYFVVEFVALQFLSMLNRETLQHSVNESDIKIFCLYLFGYFK